MLEFDHIIPVNFPEGYKEKPWCPSTKLIQIGAQLAGIEINPENFCGERMTDARYSEGAIHILKSANYFPKVSCIKVQINLTDQMKLVEKGVKEPDIRTVEADLEKAVCSEEKSAVVDKYAENMQDFQEREATIKRWRETLWEVSFSHKGDEPNIHFRQYEKAEDIPFEEVLDKVNGFTKALEKITGYKPFVIDGHGGANNCPQSPRMQIGR